MRENQTGLDIDKLVKEYSSVFLGNCKETSVILAAGHGKRIKSQTSKMLHKIWEIPTVERVCKACQEGLPGANVIIVVGIKADEVVKTVGMKKSVSYAYQEVQNGTGHAVQIALKNIVDNNYDGTVYIFPGDMGLINKETIKFFKDEFIRSSSDMMVLTGIFEGPTVENYYGRILRVPESDIRNVNEPEGGKVIEILEYKDILGICEEDNYRTSYRGKEYNFTRRQLLENREFNSGVYAFKYKPLAELINKIESNNVQSEIYLTDLIGLFNKNGYTVEAVSPKDQYVLMGFNNKSVLKEMESIARNLVYDKLKDIVIIDDPDDFFVEEDVVEEIMKLDTLGLPLDIHISKGVHIGKGVRLNYNLKLGKNVFLEGNIQFGKNVVLNENARLTCFYGQQIIINDGVEIFGGNIIKGNVTIGDNTKIESGVRITGSDHYPCIIGSRITVKGLTYIFGSKVEDQIIIEHCVLMRKKISKPEGIKSDNYYVKYYLPAAEGKEAIEDL